MCLSKLGPVYADEILEILVFNGIKERSFSGLLIKHKHLAYFMNAS